MGGAVKCTVTKLTDRGPRGVNALCELTCLEEIFPDMDVETVKDIIGSVMANVNDPKYERAKNLETKMDMLKVLNDAAEVLREREQTEILSADSFAAHDFQTVWHLEIIIMKE